MMPIGYNFMEEDILGFDDIDKRIKGLAEFKFSDFIYVSNTSSFSDVIPLKKKKEIIIVKSLKNDRRNTSQGKSKLF